MKGTKLKLMYALAQFLGKALRTALGTEKIVILDGQNMDLSTVEMLAIHEVEILGRFGFRLYHGAGCSDRSDDFVYLKE